jgi:two-component system LytT family response regulator
VNARVLVADDEPLARRTLREIVSEVPWVGEVREAADGISAARLIDSFLPDLVFLDVLMPGADGLEVLERARHQPHVVFTTAFDRYAVAAFELGALDYLLKPFGRRRVLAALARAREALTGDTSSAVARARETLPREGELATIWVKHQDRLVPVDLETVERMEACDDYVTLVTGSRRHLVHVALKDLEGRLDPRRFVRVHRSHIVNLRHVTAIEPHDATRVALVLRSGARIVASRSGSRLLRRVTREGTA